MGTECFTSFTSVVLANFGFVPPPIRRAVLVAMTTGQMLDTFCREHVAGQHKRLFAVCLGSDASVELADLLQLLKTASKSFRISELVKKWSQ